MNAERAILTAALTYPTAFTLGHVGRVDNGDGKLSIWNVAWVARTLVVDPLHVVDANMLDRLEEFERYLRPLYMDAR
jgi:hypothetical protein